MSLYTELKDRKVIRVAAVYLVVAWLIMQVVAVVSAPLLLPDWFARVVILLLTIGFPIAIILSWAFDATPAENTGTGMGKPLAIGLFALTAVVVGFILTGFDSADSEPVETLAVATAPIPIAEVADETEEVLPNSVAVLLCDNLSPDENDAYFAAGIHEEILNQLVKLSGLKVIARTSVMKYANTEMGIPEIAAELNIGSVLECSVRFAGTSILVTAQLIDPATNSHLWSETYPGDISDLSGVFAMQADIAMNIANALNTAFSPEEQERIALEPTSSPEAYRLYLGAKSLRGGIDLIEILDLIDQAIALDPEFALAYAFKADKIAKEMSIGNLMELEQVAVENAEKALLLDPSAVQALLALGEVHLQNWRKPEAENFYLNAYNLYPNDAEVLSRLASFKRSTGEFEAAIELHKESIRLDPNIANVWSRLGQTYLASKQFEAALAAQQNATAINPNSPSAQWGLILVYTALGRFEEVRASMRRIMEIPDVENAGSLSIQALSSLVVEMAGFADEDIERIVESVQAAIPEDSTGSLELALSYIAARENDKGYEEMKRAIESSMQTGDPLELALSLFIKNNVVNHSVLDEPRFVELRSQLGFQD